MKLVTLVSGGLDSTLVACLAAETGAEQFPLFVDYGQRAKNRELAACRGAMQKLGLAAPRVAQLDGWGQLIRSGLTDARLRVREDAYTPGRNTLFLLAGASYAAQVGAEAVAIGLLHEDTSLFPDQTRIFLRKAEDLFELAVGLRVRVLAPLADFHKIDVVELARQKGITQTYSCHLGEAEPCGECIACREFE